MDNKEKEAIKNSRRNKKQDLYSGIILFIFSILFFFLIIPKEIVIADQAVIQPDDLPKVCVTLIGLLSLLLIFKSLKKEKSNNFFSKNSIKVLEAKSLKSEMIDDQAGVKCKEFIQVLKLSSVILISILIFSYINILLSVVFLIVASCLVCGLTNVKTILVLTVPLISLSYLLLYKILGTAIG